MSETSWQALLPYAKSCQESLPTGYKSQLHRLQTVSFPQESVVKNTKQLSKHDYEDNM